MENINIGYFDHGVIISSHDEYLDCKKIMSSMNSSMLPALTKSDYERISHFRYRLRRFLRISEKMCKDQGLTLLQYQLLLHIKGFPEVGLGQHRRIGRATPGPTQRCGGFDRPL